VYTATLQPAPVDPQRIASIDIGLNNLATVTSNQPGFVPLLVNGRPLKAINQWYHKERARLHSQLPSEQITSRRLETLTDKRNRRVHAYLHLASHRIIETLVTQRIGTLIVGKNDGWKHQIALGKRTNQNFVPIPHARFIEMLVYKAQLVSIQTIVAEESYTSKCSFLDEEPICKHEVYVGKRIHRGLFCANDGRLIHADVNGSYNILRKVIPDAWTGKGIGGVVVHPVRLPLIKPA
jgi:putative transposase